MLLTLTEDECVDAVEAAPEAWPMDQFSTIDLSVLDANFPVAEVCVCAGGADRQGSRKRRDPALEIEPHEDFGANGHSTILPGPIRCSPSLAMSVTHADTIAEWCEQDGTFLQHMVSALMAGQHTENTVRLVLWLCFSRLDTQFDVLPMYACIQSNACPRPAPTPQLLSPVLSAFRR